MHVRSVSIVLGIVAIGLAGRSAGAAEIVTDGYASWDDAVRAMERDTHSEGTVLHVHVRDREQGSIACSDYSLQLDAVGDAAFTNEGCDGTTGATALRLVHRDALFEPAEPVPEPREVELRATISESTIARGGGGDTAGREIRCVAGVRPYLVDLQHGTRVDLEPGRYVLHPLSVDVRAEPAPPGWTLEGPAGASTHVEYEVIDTQRNVTVLHDESTLECRDTAVHSTSGLDSIGIVPPPSDVADSVRRRMNRARIVSASVMGLGPSIAGAVFLGLGIALNSSDHDLGTAYQVVGPVMMIVGAATTIVMVTRAVRAARQGAPTARAATSHARLEFVALTAAPTAGSTGLATSAVFTF